MSKNFRQERADGDIERALREIMYLRVAERERNAIAMNKQYKESAERVGRDRRAWREKEKEIGER